MQTLKQTKVLIMCSNNVKQVTLATVCACNCGSKMCIRCNSKILAVNSANKQLAAQISKVFVGKHPSNINRIYTLLHATKQQVTDISFTVQYGKSSIIIV